MKKFGNTIIIGVDHGYGNMKTASCCFRTGVADYDAGFPVFTKDMLEYESKHYLIGAGHKEYLSEKVQDEDYYLLTLAAMAMELSREGITEADVHIAAGLPLTWVGRQSAEFKAYLLRDKAISFVFRKTAYHLNIVGADVYPQGYAAIADRAFDFKGVNLLCDIGNGTMNLLYIRNGRPDSMNMYTEKFGTQQCVYAVKNAVMDRFQVTIPEDLIEDFIRTGSADIARDYQKTIIKAAKDYTEGIFRRLREHEYNPALMRLYVVGGGGCLVRNFGKYDKDRVTIDGDLCAAAKGYEFLAEHYLKAGDKS